MKEKKELKRLSGLNYLAVLFCTMFVIAISSIANAGAGRIRIIRNNETDFPTGEVELYVNFTYDPAIGQLSIDDMKTYFRTASTVLCDATDGYFRLSKIIFTKSAGGKAQADIEIKDINKAG